MSTGSHSTRDRILIAAATMLGENPTARLSVRAVAGRAGVSTGSLRHFFPTQQALIDTVVAGLFEVALPGDPMTDATMSAQDRLAACLLQILTLAGTAEQARTHWRTIFEAYITSEPPAGNTETYLALERGGRHRIERWLQILTDEGALPPGDNEQRARFLSSVVNGLSIERALPADGSRALDEKESLRLAVASVLR